MLLSEIILLEVPQLIDPISPDLPGIARIENNRSLYRFLSKRPKQLISKISDDIEVVRIEQPDHEDFNYQYVGLDHEAKRIGFIDHIVEAKDKIIGSYAYQSLIWVGDDYKSTFSRWPHRIVFEYLLPKYRTVTTDELHTPLGMKYWVHLVKSALTKGFNVYYYNKRTRQVIQIHDPQDLSDLQQQYKIWDHGPEGMDKILVISVKTIAEK
jgi:hypothetical protein